MTRARICFSRLVIFDALWFSCSVVFVWSEEMCCTRTFCSTRPGQPLMASGAMWREKLRHLLMFIFPVLCAWKFIMASFQEKKKTHGTFRDRMFEDNNYPNAFAFSTTRFHAFFFGSRTWPSSSFIFVFVPCVSLTRSNSHVYFWQSCVFIFSSLRCVGYMNPKPVGNRYVSFLFLCF